jgi:hypothetical protein
MVSGKNNTPDLSSEIEKLAGSAVTSDGEAIGKLPSVLTKYRL